jgi:hypothetical protein
VKYSVYVREKRKTKKGGWAIKHKLQLDLLESYFSNDCDRSNGYTVLKDRPFWNG